MGVGFEVSDGASVTFYRSNYKTLGVCYGFAAVFKLIFNCLIFGGRGASGGSTVVPLGRELISSHIGCQ